MDPNKTLADFMEATRDYWYGDTTNDEHHWRAMQAADSAHQLFTWLASGGFPPDWSQYREPTP